MTKARVARIFRLVIAVVTDKKAIANLEYALLAGIVFSGVINAGKLFAPKLSSAFSNIGTELLKRDAGT